VSKLWRMAAVCTVAGSVLAAGGLPAFALTRAASPSITIAATSKLEVSGDVVVLFRAANRAYTTAKISGKISGAPSGSVVKLYAQPFPYKKPARSVASAPAGSQYSFTVKPAIATRYQAELFAPDSSTTPAASSATTTVYLSSGARVTVKRDCVSRPVCRPQYRLYVFLPAALIKPYVSRHWFTYLGVSRSATSNNPPRPKWLYLDKRATVSRPRRVAADEYERTVGVTFWVGNDAARWNFLVCAKDSEAKDGVGLPGHHSCGVKRIRPNVLYLG
jgi:hypothetical protein